eukprot:TRINITY_DN61117_c0_g1_i1.p1 TRINITY_DN61117_c0_g1~~TRINITY_DN61117_c0_g1_i1.p1  ORF type:complete len:387 (+),score=48.56 TRINITY_DN61117_c0_g1_i1:216-1376(+)
MSSHLLDSYSGHLNTTAVRRLLRERSGLQRDSAGLREQGIFFSFDDAQQHRAVAMLLGPSGTPYANGFFLFEFVFPNDYPLRPPRVSFRTGDGRVRFNPNLYVTGKVCLSVLGTWAGPSWTSGCTMHTTLLSLQSLLCAVPLQNEPGHEGSIGADANLYSAMLRYETVAVAVVHQLSRPLPKAFEPFTDTMRALFLRHFTGYLAALDEFTGCEGKCDRCPVFHFITRYSVAALRQRLEALRLELPAEHSNAIGAASTPGPVAVNLALPLLGNAKVEGETFSNRGTAIGSESPTAGVEVRISDNSDLEAVCMTTTSQRSPARAALCSTAVPNRIGDVPVAVVNVVPHMALGRRLPNLCWVTLRRYGLLVLLLIFSIVGINLLFQLMM